MPRNGSGVYSYPAGGDAVAGATIDSTKYNTRSADVLSDLNAARPITVGGTGATSASAALTNLFSGAAPGGADKIGFWDQSESAFGWLSLGSGLSFSGTTLSASGLQPIDPTLTSIAALTPAANTYIYFSAEDVATTGAITDFVRTAAASTKTSGDLTLNDNVGLSFGTDADVRIFNNGSSLYIDVDNDHTIYIRDKNSSYATRFSFSVSAGELYSNGSNLFWNAGNDGSGSGLDADLLDGLHATAFVRNAVDTWLADSDGDERIYWALNGANYFKSANGNHFFRNSSDTDVVQIGQTGSIAASGSLSVSGNTSGGGPATSSSTSGTLTSEAAGKVVFFNNNTTIPASVFAAGTEIILINTDPTDPYNIVRGSGLTLYNSGTNSATIVVAAKRMARLIFQSTTVAFVSILP